MHDISKSNNFSQKAIAQRAIMERHSELTEDLLALLNPEQKKAVETTEGALLVLAGAGTGKTQVLTSRIAYILTTGKASPEEILSVTFTNKAANEMKQRVGLLMNFLPETMPWMGTFHSIGLKIIRRHPECSGLKSNFSVLDTDDQIRLMKQIMKKDGLDEKKWPARLLAGIIDNWKNEALRPEDVSEHNVPTFGNGRSHKLYEIYQKELQNLNACDFGDLLLHPLWIFRSCQDILEKYQKRFRYILVDEYQDSNTTQYMFLRLLCQNSRESKEEGKTANICCVGDDDQAIYGWRGAKVSNILRFEKDFPSSTLIRLERNYRSTSHILAAASYLIAHNTERIGKTLRTQNESILDQPVWIHAARDSSEEAYSICEIIQKYHSEGARLNNIAILVRASFQMREFEDAFVTAGMNYRVIGGPRFYERLEIRDALAFFRIVSCQEDNLAFERIINVPKKGIGEKTINLIRVTAGQNQESMLEAATRIIKGETGKNSRKELQEVLSNFERWRQFLETIKHTQLAEMILEESGYTDMWRNDPSPKAGERVENLKELIRSMEEYESLRSFLDHVALVTDRESQHQRDAVSIMTLHAAKGLEFETVFLPGWEEELFPHPRTLNESGQKGLEEERRLAYVGLTRAKKTLHIWFSCSRRIYGTWQRATPSRFLEELPEKHIEIAQRPTSNSAPFSLAAHREENDEERQGSKYDHKKENEDTKTSTIKTGDSVRHCKFGTGKVIAIEGKKLTVNFGNEEHKKILKHFIKKI